MIIRKFVNIEQRINRCEPVSSLPDKTIPGQSYTIEELLRRSQNGTFPDINFNTDYDQEMLPDSSDGSEVQFDDHDFVDHLDVGQAMLDLGNLNEGIDKVLRRQKVNFRKRKTTNKE